MQAGTRAAKNKNICANGASGEYHTEDNTPSEVKSGEAQGDTRM